MSVKNILVMVVVVAWTTASCSVISSEIRKEAIPPVPFAMMAEKSNQYTGQTVILGGYIIETKNLGEKTVIEALQTPLGFQDEPKGKDTSEGRLVISYNGFLDPEVYSKDRKITVAGVLDECTPGPPTTCHITSRQIYLWPQYDYDYPFRGFYLDDPYYWYGYGPYERDFR